MPCRPPGVTRLIYQSNPLSTIARTYRRQLSSTSKLYVCNFSKVKVESGNVRTQVTLQGWQIRPILEGVKISWDPARSVEPNPARGAARLSKEKEKLKLFKVNNVDSGLPPEEIRWDINTMDRARTDWQSAGTMSPSRAVDRIPNSTALPPSPFFHRQASRFRTSRRPGPLLANY
jgi:hypothetical protein